MSSLTVLDRLRKRRHYPVTAAGEGVFVRSLTKGELRRIAALDPSVKDEFLFGCVLVDAAGQPVFAQPVGEADADFAARVKDALADVDTETLNQVGEAVAKIGRVPPVEDLAKN